jgi:predicted O-linked N-acetylglucosamine transferase (SPINDLY family)
MPDPSDFPTHAQSSPAPPSQAGFEQALALQRQGRLAEAERIYRELLQRQPGHFAAWHQLGLIALDTQHLEQAAHLIGRAIALKPDLAQAHSDLGMALRKLNRCADALASYDRAIALKPDFAMAYNNRANALLDLKRPAEALASCEQAISLRPDFALAHYNRAVALNVLARFSEAVRACDRAIALAPDFAEAHQVRGHALNYLKRFEAAIAAYDRAVALKPNLTGAEGDRLFAKMRICDWRDFDADSARLIASVRNGEANTSPFPFIAIASSCDDQLRCAKLWTANHFGSAAEPLRQGGRDDRDRIRIGYFSADFHGHATGYLAAELFEIHDRSRFELIAFSFGPEDTGEMRQRLRAAFDQFIDVRNLSDRAVAAFASKLEIDIAVDLKGFTTDSRTGIFALRPAPVQVSYLGYPGTMGADFIDYLIADRVLIPAASRRCFAEKIAYLPNSYQVNGRGRQVADRTFTRSELGLPEAAFVFCCFNNNYKINPATFDSWMRLLKRVAGSVLWLFEDNAGAAANLRREAAARGVDPERIIFAGRMALPEHLARHRLADLFLDTLPCNAHTTASDALWAGLPVVTQIGETFAGRVAASLLTALGLPELIAPTAQAYEELAFELAVDAGKRAAITRKLADNRLTTPLFDAALFARHIEAAYAAMHARQRAGLPPDHIDVATDATHEAGR